MTSSGTATDRRRPRITHLVLVDGLPADHWVEEGADAAHLVPGRGAAGPRARVAELATDLERRDHERSWLEALVGGPDALAALDAEPLPPRLFTLPDLGPDLGPAGAPAVAARAIAIGAECDRIATEVFDDAELGAALRRLWEAALAIDPAMLVRSSRDDTAVGALVWVTLQANGLLGATGRMLARELWPRLGVPASAAGRGAALLERLAPGSGLLVPPPGAPRLRATGRSDVLLASTRRLLVQRRDELRDEFSA
ncbi:hypothetical protein SAMN04489867_2774 [Pedococcus dokdonensis]|uniref:Uncharacterized protein n=1 Tax=Pedococcus dokdonensis TaxID=443156 RepID=A0A1H0TEC6_9MICO|nr:hypothetical protein [Pedococcus dokdonensis]SDP52387.1 hypothetical protein SAMN04489867_2774 [Pedococcus dokdonensis]